jgi:hypothetical protein
LLAASLVTLEEARSEHIQVLDDVSTLERLCAALQKELDTQTAAA